MRIVARSAVSVMSWASGFTFAASVSRTFGPLWIRDVSCCCTVRICWGSSRPLTDSEARSLPRSFRPRASWCTRLCRAPGGTALNTLSSASMVFSGSGGCSVSWSGMVAPFAMTGPVPGVMSTTRSPMGERRVIAACEPCVTVMPGSRLMSTVVVPSLFRTTFDTAPEGTPRIVTSSRGSNPWALENTTFTVRPPLCDRMNLSRPRKISSDASVKNTITLMTVRFVIMGGPRRRAGPASCCCRNTCARGRWGCRSSRTR